MGQYNGGITRDQFLFYEMRVTAKLMTEGLSDDEITERIQEENLYQLPTEKSVARAIRCCLRRLHVLEDDILVDTVANGASEDARQVCLYMMMAENCLVYEFMVSVIGNKYATKDFSYGKIDLNGFFMRLQEQDNDVASWSESTVSKIKQVLNKLLADNEYIDDTKADHLNPVWPCSILKNAIIGRGDMNALAAFNCFI